MSVVESASASGSTSTFHSSARLNRGISFQLVIAVEKNAVFVGACDSEQGKYDTQCSDNPM